MSALNKWIFGLGVGALVVTACPSKTEIILKAASWKSRMDVAPHQPIAWQTGGGPTPASPADRRPNIVVIMADDLGWNDLSGLGGGVADGTVPTPHLEALAQQGVRFNNGYSANGTCAPSRASMLSGRYSTRFGFEFTPVPDGMVSVASQLGKDAPGRLRGTIVSEDAPSISYPDMGMPPDEITLAELLQGAGYHTVHIGKWHLGRTGGMGAHEQGFDESLLLESGMYLPEDDPGVVNAKQPFDPIDRFMWASLHYAASFNGGPAFAPDGYLTDYYTDQAVQVIEANRDRPFFLYLAHWSVHTPLQALQADYDALSHIEDHRLRVYAAMVRSLDRSVGRVVEALRVNGLEDNTLVFFTSDNGAPNYLGLPDVNQPFRGWKISFFEGGIHVPYFLKWPAGLEGGQTFDPPVHGFDIFATAAAAAGVPVPDDRPIDGVDLVPHVRGERPSPPHERLFWRSGSYQAVIEGDHKLQISDPPGAKWLFDLSVDPTEQHDLADTQPERVAALEARLAEHNADQMAPMWPSSVMLPVNIDKTLVDPDAPDDAYIYWPN